MTDPAPLPAHVAQVLDRDWKLLIAGEPRPAEGGRTFAKLSPVTETVIAQVPDATPADVETAVAGAYAARKGWRDTVATERAALVRRLADPASCAEL
ncbi:MAG: hypothetical protein QOE32_3180, partial [Pseudonocardiales bacterium]|nr:hypothetical protein [Pseudonocardiales bacterium]